MGREAVCTCDWAGTVTEVKALLETGELILRGEIRKRVTFNEIRDVQVRSGSLYFKAGGEAVELVIGAALAGKWSATITSPPVSLARKLGITDKTVVRMIGGVGDENLKAAVAEAARVSSRGADLIVACVDTPESLQAALKQAGAALAERVPIWVVYAKGPGHGLNETAIRSLLRGNGLMDTKVASVSSALTALRFSRSNSD
ncbi:MAG: hypothetical protein ACLPY1_00070 [Terracidiphilus sp.]